MMAGSASDVCKINIQLQTESTEGEIGNYGEIMKKKKKKEDEGEKMIWIFCFVFCHHSGISSWSSSPRGVWSADVSDIHAAANICHLNSWPLFWLVFKKLTQNYFWETIRGRTSWLPPLSKSWKLGVWSSSLVQLLVGVSLRIWVEDWGALVTSDPQDSESATQIRAVPGGFIVLR